MEAQGKNLICKKVCSLRTFGSLVIPYEIKLDFFFIKSPAFEYLVNNNLNFVVQKN